MPANLFAAIRRYSPLFAGRHGAWGMGHGAWDVEDE